MDIKSLAKALNLKIPKKFPFLRNGIQIVVNVPNKRVLKVDTVAGNVETEIKSVSGKKLMFIGGRIYLDTDATAATRYIRVTKENGSDVIYDMGQANNLTANQLGALNFVPESAAESGARATSPLNVNSAIGLNFPIPIQGEDILKISITNGVAGDSYKYVLEFEEVALA